MPATRVILFDIDGTLLLTGGASTRCFRRTIAQLGGTLPDDLNLPSGRLDSEIVAYLIELGQLEVTAERIAQAKQLYTQALQEDLSQPKSETTHNARLLPGVADLIGRLQAAPEVALGLLTGNFHAAIESKLNAVQLPLDTFKVIACDEDGAQRPELPPIAIARLREQGIDSALERTTIIGDTPGDIAAAKSNNCQSIAVATGRYSVEQLSEHQPTLAVETLESTEVVELLFRNLIAGGGGAGSRASG